MGQAGVVGGNFEDHFIFRSEMLAKRFENFCAMFDEIAIFKHTLINHAFGCHMEEQVLKRFVEFSHKNLRLVVTDAKLLFDKCNGVLEVRADTALEINVGFGGFR